MVEANNPCVRSDETSQTMRGYANHFSVMSLIDAKAARLIPITIKIIKHIGQIRMLNRATIGIWNKILLANIGCVETFLVFRQEMIVRLLAARTNFRRNGIIPFFGVIKFRINIKHDPAKRVMAVTDNITNIVYWRIWIIFLFCHGLTTLSQDGVARWIKPTG